jgi:pyruvate dehydrogenase E2 component (dihydrolipoamide acetyltransferase)
MLGVELRQVAGSGERGRITPADVHAFVQTLARNGNGAGAASAPASQPAMPDFSAYGPVEVLPLSSVRKRTAEAMSRSWNLIPHVTHHDLADVTDLEAARKAFRKGNPRSPKVTMTVLVAKACAAALRAYPDLNSSIDVTRGQQVFKHHYHVGIAVDTDYGLVVPVLRDVDKKPIIQLAAELTDLAVRARERKLKPQEMRGATFTVSNLGGIGGVGFTPIVNWPQVAILGVSRSRQEYRPTAGGPVPRLMMPLSLSYDHRLVDGAQAARFVAYLTGLLTSPGQLVFAL